MHYGFATPMIGILLVNFGCIFYFRSWRGVLFAALATILFGALSAFADWRFQAKVREWARSQALTSVVSVPRGGFVSWGWSLWSWADTQRFHAQDALGNKREILASYSAPVMGTLLFTCCELQDPPPDRMETKVD